MADEERNNQPKTGDPFSIFGELTSINSALKNNLDRFTSDTKELIFRVTMRRAQKSKTVLGEEEKALLSRIKQNFRDTTELRKRGMDLINTTREAYNKQD